MMALLMVVAPPVPARTAKHAHSAQVVAGGHRHASGQLVRLHRAIAHNLHSSGRFIRPSIYTRAGTERGGRYASPPPLRARSHAASRTISDVNRLTLRGDGKGAALDLAFSAPVGAHVFRLHNPERIVIDLPGAHLRTSLPAVASSSAVTAIRSGFPEHHLLRLVLDCNPALGMTPLLTVLGNDTTRLRVQLGSTVATSTGAPVLSAAPNSSAATAIVSPPAAGGAVGATATAVAPVMTASAGAKPEGVAMTDATLPATTPVATSLPAPEAGVIASGPAPLAAPATPTATATATVIATATASTIGPLASTLPAGASPGASNDAAASTVPLPSTATPIRAAHAPRGEREVIVAVDAGHGGDDPGASGKNGTHEKDVTLAIARSLAARINAAPGMRAVLTRDGDYFVPLRDRMERARAARADMFVSIHADAIRNRAVSGASVYILSERGASSEAARRLAEHENSVDLKGGVSLAGQNPALRSVLLDLSQNASIGASSDAAQRVLGALDGVGAVRKRRVQQAAFVVLKSPDMPSMLVETAYISNPTEEQRLRTAAGQQRLAAAIFSGIDSYFRSFPPEGSLYARARAAAIPPHARGGF